VNLIHASGLEKAYGDRSVLRGADLAVAPGERVGLVGVNGSGKTTLLKVLSGQLEADHGAIHREGSHGLLSQIPDLPGATVADAMRDAVAWHRDLVAAYEAAVAAHDVEGMAHAQERLDLDGWTIDHKVDAVMERLGAPPRDATLASLSGGEKRRVSLARVLLQQPDLLMLDEPTNHLDADTCEWLQGLLAGWRGGVLLVTHDRYLLEAVATRIVEIEDGESVVYEGSYTDYLLARAERRARLEKADEKRVALIRQEAAWAARSPAARSTKQKARLQRLDALQEQRPLSYQDELHLDLSTGHRRGGPLLEARGLRHAYGDLVLLDDVNLVLRAGETVGILGPNGAGKSTLLKILAGRLQPDAGDIVKAPRLNAAVLDQHRTGLNLEHTVWEAAGDGNDHVFVGEKPVHVASFLERFHFPREVFNQKAAALSGGERARLLLARLMLHGANLLLLDEPTNDLDLLTLRVLEAALMDYDGAAVVVTHDRAFLDRVCDHVLAFEGDGEVVRYASRVQHLAAVRARDAAAQQAQAEAAAKAARQAAARAPAPAAKAPAGGRLSYKEKREFEALPGQIEALEAEQAEVEARLADPALYASGDAGEVARLSARMSALPDEVEALYDRWSALEARA
jgi:ATP-binding cassette subfamily F protein uup